MANGRIACKTTRNFVSSVHICTKAQTIMNILSLSVIVYTQYNRNLWLPRYVHEYSLRKKYIHKNINSKLCF